MKPALQSALDASGYVGAWETDLATQVVTVTGKAADLLGIEQRRAASGVPVAIFLEGVHPKDRGEVAHRVQEAHRSAGRFEAEFRTGGSDDQSRVVLARGKVETAPEGHGLRCVGIMVDVTDSRRFVHADEQMQAISQVMDALVELRPLAERVGSRTLQALIDMALVDLRKRLDDQIAASQYPRR